MTLIDTILEAKEKGDTNPSKILMNSIIETLVEKMKQVNDVVVE